MTILASDNVKWVFTEDDNGDLVIVFLDRERLTQKLAVGFTIAAGSQFVTDVRREIDRRKRALRTKAQSNPTEPATYDSGAKDDSGT